MASGTPEIRLYNTLTREKSVFTPIDPANVRMYVCGPTVYDYAHIGNARPVIVFDVLFRLLRHVYGAEHVTYVRNITDVDDKINARAARDFPGLPLNEAIRKVTEATAGQFEKDVAALGCLKPTVEPRATENIAEMRALITDLLEGGHAYQAGGEVLFDVASMPDYGRLSRRPLDEQQAGARVAVEAHKKNPGDFVLWKLSNADEPGWDSPWGRGRPGWHIECSAMSDKFLWERLKDHLSEKGREHPHVFDIHAGGLDLIFPHHENEIAQSRCGFHTPAMANVWMHNGFLQVEGRKMSKSEGNFVTIHDLLETEKFGGRRWPGEVLRLAMLMTHYREPIDFSVARLEEALALFRSFAQIVRDYTYGPTVDELFVAALGDDLNTSGALKRLVVMRDEATDGNVDAGRRLLGTLRVLGLFTAGYQLKLTIHYPAADLTRVSADDFVAANMNLAEDTPATVVVQSVAASHPNDGAHIVEALQAFGPVCVWRDVTTFAERLSLDMPGRAIARRLDALAAKDFATADRIRADLLEQGIQLMDYKDPQTGERKTKWEVKR